MWQLALCGALALTATPTPSAAPSARPPAADQAAERALEGAVTVLFVGERPEDKKFADELTRAFAAALANAGIDFVKPPARPLNEVKFAVGCGRLDEACAASIGESAGARQLVLAAPLLDPAPAVVYSIIDVASRKRVVLSAAPLARFDAVGAQQVAAAIARDLGAAAWLRVRSQPAGAAVRVDGELAGETPFEVRGVSAGPHTVAIKFADGLAIEQTALVRDGEETLVEATREGGAASGGLRTPALVGWSLLGGSALAAVAGGVLGTLAALAQGRSDAERVVNGVTVQDVQRSEAKALAREIETEVIAAEVAFAASLALALGSALLFGVAGE